MAMNQFPPAVTGSTGGGTASTVLVAVKALNTDRTTSTKTADPELSLAIASAGTYLVDFECYVPASVKGVSGEFTYSGTLTDGRMISKGNESNTATFLAAPLSVGLVAAGNATATTIRVYGFVSLSTAGTFAFQWAQTATDGTATRVNAGSFLRILKKT